MPTAPVSRPARRRRPGWPIAIAAAMLVAGPARGAALADGDILVADSSSNKLFVIDPVTGVATAIASAGMVSVPIGVAVRADGFAFLTNIGSQLVLRIDPTAVSPAPVQVSIAGFPNVRGIVADPGGDLFISSPNTDEILRVDAVTGAGRPASSAGFIQFPTGLVREKPSDAKTKGTLVVADSNTGPTGASRIYRVHLDDGAQDLLAAAGSFQVLRDIEIDPVPTEAGSFLVVDSGARKVFRVDATIPYDSTNPGANQSIWAACPEFVSPRGIAVEQPSGSVLVSDFSAKKVFRINQTPVPRVCSALATGSALAGPWDVTVATNLVPFVPGALLVADAGTGDQVYRVDPVPPGTRTAVTSNLPFADPVAVIRDLNGDLLVLEPDRILRVTPGGVQTTITTFTGTVDLTGIVVDSNGEILVTDAANDRLVRVIPGTGQQIVVVDDTSMPAAPLADPRGLTLDGNGTALVAIGGNANATPVIKPGIVRVNPISGSTVIVTDDTQFGKPVALALDKNGDYLIADEPKDTVWRFQPNIPVMFPVSVGNQIESLRGIAVDVNRTVVVSNQGAAKILRIDPNSGVQSVVPPSAAAYSDIQGIALDQIPIPPPLDSDSDGIPNAVDNCPDLANPDQLDTDHDGKGDVCDDDIDGDGVLNANDNCTLVANPDQRDTNHDGYGNACDADFDNNGGVGASDYGLFKQMFGLSVPNPDPTGIADFDLDGSGAIGVGDFGILRSQFGHKPGPSGLTCAGTIPCP